MPLKLKENPREWQKLVMVLAIVIGVLTVLMVRRGTISRATAVTVAILLGLALVACLIRPRWFRGFYRAWMTGGHHIGQVMGKVLLTVLFLILVIPLGILLRLMGKDLLHLKKKDQQNSYWEPARPDGPFDRPF